MASDFHYCRDSGITTSDLYLLDYTNAKQTTYTLYNEEGMGVGYTSGGEYRPEKTDTEKITFAGPVLGDGVKLDAYEKRYLHISMQCSNLGTTDSYIEVPLLFYKGYAARGKKYRRKNGTVCRNQSGGPGIDSLWF